jgi:Spy/CpxP family protein refolding chaperone
MSGSGFPGLRKKGLALGALAVFSIGTLAAGLAPARPHGGGCEHRGGLEWLERKLEKLELDEATRANATALFERANAELQALHEQKRAAHEQLRELMAQEPAPLDAVMAQAEEIGAIRTEADKARLRSMLELRSLLGPERWAEFEALRKEHRRHERPDEKS